MYVALAMCRRHLGSRKLGQNCRANEICALAVAETD